MCGSLWKTWRAKLYALCIGAPYCADSITATSYVQLLDRTTVGNDVTTIAECGPWMWMLMEYGGAVWIVAHSMSNQILVIS